MLKDVVAIEIDAPREVVAERFADPENNPKWMQDTQYEPIRGEPGTPGSTFRPPKKPFASKACTRCSAYSRGRRFGESTGVRWRRSSGSWKGRDRARMLSSRRAAHGHFRNGRRETLRALSDAFRCRTCPNRRRFERSRAAYGDRWDSSSQSPLHGRRSRRGVAPAAL